MGACEWEDVRRRVLGGHGDLGVLTASFEAASVQIGLAPSDLGLPEQMVGLLDVVDHHVELRVDLGVHPSGAAGMTSGGELAHDGVPGVYLGLDPG